ncbi:RagB/SusD family nutrient uptake outer membrane protein [Compostibacter hankyongensis]|uniref:RagB/SusD family nutrient uptake outer membrane protein n=1 Tax=Compostibacter hankyongensis TaxID=1007089 RepID=A0ABP8G389_9BACT
MKKLCLILLVVTAALGCNKMQDDWLDKKPTDVLLNDQVWSDPKLVFSVLADLYDRIPDYQQLEQFANFADFDEAFASSYGDYHRHQNQTYDYTSGNYWDYGYIRDINLFIQKCRLADKLDSTDRNRFLAEAQFLRANVYFELVKRMGGVPLILDTMHYNYSGDPTYLQHPRNKESEIYDFVISELDSTLNFLPKDAGTKSRATWGAALAMKSRAALYAGSIARYGATTPTVSLPGDVVGIPAGKAESYYRIALDAAQELINSHIYSLYLKNPDDLQKNFSQLFTDKSGNPEVIFAKDYLIRSRTTQFTVQNQPHSITEEGSWSGFLNPSLNLAQSFEKLDNTFAPFAVKDPATGDDIPYDDPQDIFSGRDARLGGTVILPGTQFRDQNLDIWAGYVLANGSIVTGSTFGQKKDLPGKPNVQVVGFDGPIDQLEHGTQTGFYIRKFLDPSTGAGQIGTGSEVWWVRYRYGEVLLNAAEAAFELGQKDQAAVYMNQVRARAGLNVPLKAADITFDRVVHERKVELAFEGHELYDMKRWRLAHKVWNGASSDLTTLPGKADAPSTRIFGLWPYKIYDPGHPDNGKWVFKKVMPSAVTNAHRFRLGNYYSRIPDDVMGNNPKLIQNPNQ